MRVFFILESIGNHLQRMPFERARATSPPVHWSAHSHPIYICKFAKLVWRNGEPYATMASTYPLPELHWVWSSKVPTCLRGTVSEPLRSLWGRLLHALLPVTFQLVRALEVEAIMTVTWYGGRSSSIAPFTIRSACPSRVQERRPRRVRPVSAYGRTDECEGGLCSRIRIPAVIRGCWAVSLDPAPGPDGVIRDS